MFRPLWAMLPSVEMLTRPVAAAAARINASLQAKKGVQSVSVPPIKSASSASEGRSATTTINTEMYVADGDYIKDIEINDLRNRYLVTKGSTQAMVNIFTVAIQLIRDVQPGASRSFSAWLTVLPSLLRL